MQGIKKDIKERVDSIVVERNQSNRYSFIGSLLDAVVPHVLQNYDACRDVVQFFIGQLERIPDVCVPYLFSRISSLLDVIQVENTKPAIAEYIQSDWDGDVTALFDKVASFLAGKQCVTDLHPEVADALSEKERRFVASTITQMIQRQGVETLWTEETFQNSLFFCNILYPICKKDNVMGLLFLSYNNIIDRLNNSGFCQQARDLAEGLLVIGYKERLEAESYFSACRAYIGANNIVAGTLFYYICLYVITNNAKKVNRKFAYDLYWQYLKVCRAYGIYPQEDVIKVTKAFEKLDNDNFDRMSFYHTLFYTRLKANRDTDGLVKDVTEFLDSNREAFFANLDHGSMPWITLLVSMQEVLPDQDYSGVQPYVTAARQVAQRKGNELLFDILEETNLFSRLKEFQYKLQKTRNRSDYSMDNEMAMIVAKKLLNQSYIGNDPSGFLLSMSSKTDFSTVQPNTVTEGFYKQFDVEDVEGDDLSSIYNNPKVVQQLMCTDDNDIIYWIGRGKKEFLVLTSFKGQYEMSGKINLQRERVKDTVETKVANLRYERMVTDDRGSTYVKSDNELEEDGIDMASSLKEYAVNVPEEADRLIFIKDLEIASYPHNLFVKESTGEFVSSLKPCCNALSTEVFFKTNTLDPLPDNFSKAFWIPYGSEEFTFDMIYGKLEDVIKEHDISVQNTLSTDNPLSADITMLCAHGGVDVSTTEVFYVADRPILDILPCVGKGRIALLFVCYSGSISRTNIDNAMHTLAKKLIMKGYSSIVAPMWSLNTEIIKPWLSTFLDYMESGDYIIDAVFKANMKIKQEFIAPSAWACLHLFGNPYTRVAEVPRIRIELD